MRRIIVIFCRQLLAVLTITIAMLGTFISQSCFASEDINLLILLPKLNANYNTVFAEVIRGINSFPDTQSTTLTITSSTQVSEINNYIETNRFDALISLGQSTYDFSHQLNSKLPIIHGALMLKPGEHSGISLSSSPNLFFSNLVKVAPHVERVFTVYNKENSGWIIELAENAAKQHGIELLAYEANDVRHAAHQFKYILEQAHDKRDSIWIMLDKVVPDKSLLPLALKAAWEKRITIFSNSPSHTKRGALFSLFPHHQNMGFSLAKLAHEVVTKDNGALVLPLEDTRVAINKRTASHLGLSSPILLSDEIDIIYPLK